MKFNKEYLESQRGQIIGKWNGNNIYSYYERDLKKKRLKDNEYYLVIDANNRIVDSDGVSEFMVLPTGTVMKSDRRIFKVKEVEDEAIEIGIEAITVPLVDSGTDDFFDRIDREIEELLK